MPVRSVFAGRLKLRFMDKKETYLHTIAESYPDLQIQSARLHTKEGQYNNILIVNEEIVFRFPRYKEGVLIIRDEVNILSRIQGETTLPIPNPTYTRIDEDEPGKVFMGYRMIPGEPLWRDTFQHIQDELVLERFADQLARFLRELHGIPVDQLGSGIPTHDSVAEMKRLYQEIQKHLFSFMRPDARESVVRYFDKYINTPGIHKYPITLHHGDFGGSNILFDRETLVITGVIDFGFAGLGDPAQDIAAVSTFGESFLTWLYRTYPEIESMLERARFYRGTFALCEALHGIKSGHEEAFRDGMAQYI